MKGHPIRRLVLGAAALAALVGCSGRPTPAAEFPMQPPAPSATFEPTATATPTPEPTATPTPTATLAPPMVQSKYLDLACRFGFGSEWVEEGVLPQKTLVPILGRNQDSSWWNIANPDDGRKTCWIPARQTSAEGDLEAVPVTAQSDAIVGHITVDINPNEETIACFAFPFEFEVQTTIGVTGPVTIQLHRSDSVNGSRPAKTLALDRGRNWVYLDRIVVNDPSDVWFRAEVTGPNAMAASASASVDCTNVVFP